MGRKQKLKRLKKLKSKSDEIKTKTKEDREEQVKVVRNKFLSLGFPTTDKNVIKVMDIFNNFIENGKSFTGKVKLMGYERVVEIILSNKKHIQPSICLKYNKDV